MIINGGTISGSASSKGYSVYVDAGTAITMTGGTITSSTGGGVYLYPGWDDETINTEGMSSFTMTGGTITGNGGIGVYVFDGCTFTLNGGTISDNSGSGVYVYGYGEMAASGTASAKFEMKSGTITGNSATYGGGVYVVAGNGNAVFTMTGGAIYDNTASKAGNDVYSVKDYDAGTVSVKLIAVDLMYADGVDFSSLAWYEDYENTTDDATGLMVNRYSSDNVTNVVSVDYAITSSIALTVADGAFYLGVSGSSTQVPAMISSELGGTTLYFKVSSEYFGDDYYTTNSYPETSLTFTETTVTDDGYSETSTHSYIFAGWYSYDSETGKYSAMTSFPEEADAYAKFVDANVLTVKAQLATETSEESETASIRFVSTVDSLNYSSVGFKISVGSNSISHTSQTVYMSLVGEDGNEVVTYKPTEFSSLSMYFITCTLINIPNKGFESKTTVQATWTTLDGTTVYGEARDITVNELLNATSSNS